MIIALVLIVAGVAGFMYFWPISSTVTPQPIEQACTLEAKACPDGSYVGRTGPNCEFAPCPGPSQGEIPVVNGVPKLPSHETIAAIAGCTDKGKAWMWNYGEKQSWKCSSLESNIEPANFPPYEGYSFFSDPISYGLDFPALTYYVSFTPDQEVPVINKDCIQICGGPRLMAYIDGEWKSIDTKEELLAESGTIDSPAEALAVARYITGNKVGEEVDIPDLETKAEANTDGTFHVTLYASTGGICCGTNYEYYRIHYGVDAQGNITEVEPREHVGIVPNTSIA